MRAAESILRLVEEDRSQLVEGWVGPHREHDEACVCPDSEPCERAYALAVVTGSIASAVLAKDYDAELNGVVRLIALAVTWLELEGVR